MAEKKVPIRTCVCCRKEFPKKELIRIVNGNDGVFVDFSGKADGRGAYLCGGEDCMKKFKKSKSLDRAFKTTVPPEIYESIWEAILGKR